MEDHDKNKSFLEKSNTQQNECPEKDEEGNCLVPGTYSDSDPIGGG